MPSRVFHVRCLWARVIPSVNFQYVYRRGDIELKSIFNEHAAAIIVVIGTLLGVLISQLTTCLMKKN